MRKILWKFEKKIVIRSIHCLLRHVNSIVANFLYLQKKINKKNAFSTLAFLQQLKMMFNICFFLPGQFFQIIIIFQQLENLVPIKWSLIKIIKVWNFSCLMFCCTHYVLLVKLSLHDHVSIQLLFMRFLSLFSFLSLK